MVLGKIWDMCLPHRQVMESDCSGMVPESKTFFFPSERGGGISVAKVPISIVGDMEQKMKYSFRIYIYFLFYLHFWPQNKVFFRVKILPVPLSATFECS